jgi:hypothetical protein
VAGTEPDHDRGQAAFAAMSNAYCAAVPRLYRDRFAASSPQSFIMVVYQLHHMHAQSL